MTARPNILLLAGAREATDAAAWLQAVPCTPRVLWAEGARVVPLGMPRCSTVPPDTDAVLDATHAFDIRTRQIAWPDGCAYARIGRDTWVAGRGDDWTHCDTLEAAIAALPRKARVFAATGRDSLPLLARHDGPVFLRQLTHHMEPTGVDNCSFVFGTAPFTESGEVKLMQDLDVDVVLARNIGGPGAFPKLAAARTLGLPVVLLNPPPTPAGPRLSNADDVAKWVATL
ncbi:precorrin-6A/cobalt-precorrin-6A reductase [uncultured Tateyamaria sp.]|uniref:precorrin-6A/cobalt-precorrin-6A reductase n=1 Tax=uncultured Tateyamaria sp. TaxID=455651 RepID=UPI002627C527|nr:precorrin-6A/cobalt-precorrin-6A reductase [uncultured Tateyamaria sp.]